MGSVTAVGAGRCDAGGALPAVAHHRIDLRSGGAPGGQRRVGEPEGEVQVVPAYEKREALPERRSQRSYYRMV